MPDTASPNKGKARTNLDFYHSPTQLRFDTWHRIEENTSRLREKHMRKADIAALSKKIRADLSTIEVFESYCAFPSRDGVRLLSQLLEQQDYDQLSRVVARIVRALTNGTYRSTSIDLQSSIDLEESDDTLQNFDEGHETRPYFELLFVDESGHEDVRRLRDRLNELRRPEDNFVYDIVVVPSFEDALIAVLFNYNIQAVVIRYGFPLHSVNHLEILQRYLSKINESDYEDALDIERGPLLGNLIAEMRPELDLYLVTDAAVEDIAGNVTQKFNRIF